MEEKQLTPEESMVLIGRMIDASKRRVAVPDLRISVMWAALSVATAAAVWLLWQLTGDVRFNFVWFAIPVIGIPLNILLADRSERPVKTYVDRICEGVGKILCALPICLTVLCLAFQWSGYPQAWLTFFFFAFIVVGFGAAMQGIVLEEKSYLFGGLFSMLTGFVVAAAAVSGLPLRMGWMIPLYMLCFVLMFLVPAIVIRRKLKRSTR